MTPKKANQALLILALCGYAAMVTTTIAVLAAGMMTATYPMNTAFLALTVLASVCNFYFLTHLTEIGKLWVKPRKPYVHPPCSYCGTRKAEFGDICAHCDAIEHGDLPRWDQDRLNHRYCIVPKQDGR